MVQMWCSWVQIGAVVNQIRWNPLRFLQACILMRFGTEIHPYRCHQRIHDPGSFSLHAVHQVFFTTTFLFETLAVGAAYVANYTYLRSKDADCAELQCTLLHKTLCWLVITAIVLPGIEFLVAPMYVA
jgi:hypothetical protein